MRKLLKFREVAHIVVGFQNGVDFLDDAFRFGGVAVAFGEGVQHGFDLVDIRPDLDHSPGAFRHNLNLAIALILDGMLEFALA